MQQAADEAVEWARLNNMKLNASKTRELVMHFGKNNIEVPKVTIEDEVIDRTHCAKLLGALITDKRDWDEQVSHINTKASKRLFYIRQLKRSGLSQNELVQIY